jgi:DNA replication protein DnaC
MNDCPICGGSGLVEEVSATGLWVSRACKCQMERREERRLAGARIPARYSECSFEEFDTDFRSADPSLKAALRNARSYVDEYLSEEGEKKGLLFTGSIGSGKTHLAVAILRQLIKQYGVRGLFCDYRELLKNIQNSYNPQVNTTELELLKPVFAAEVLVLDDLGAQKPTEWMSDTVSLILNTRYNERRTTIITTNYPDLPAGGGEKNDAERSARAFTLGDRIGDRMRSRLSEMCMKIEMTGVDYRETIKKAWLH